MKKYYVLAAFMSVLLIGQTVRAQDADDDSEGDDATASTDTVSRDAWIPSMVKALPEFACKDKSYFVTCFGMTIPQCSTAIGTLTQTCATKLKSTIPAELTKDLAGEYGGKIGECAGDLFETQNAAKKVNSPACNNPEGFQ
jgi:hypothetical protein